MQPTRLTVCLAAVAVALLLAGAGTALVVVPGDAPAHHAALRSTPPVVPPPPTPTPTPTPTPRPTLHMTADRVAIPSQDVVAPVDVCHIVDGGLEPPTNVHRTCDWAGGAGLDALVGTTVITGHINWVGQGTGALGHLDRLRPGGLVRTSDSHGVVTTWRIASVRHRPKTTGVDTAAFVGKAGARQLYLISCGGAFDAAEASYLDNIYVRALPLNA